MSVGIGSGTTASSGTDTSALYRQLKADQTALQNAEKQHAAQAVIAADEARVAADQQAIATAEANAHRSTGGSGVYL
jgi:multidrug efflux pump subunit AcrA (membrane-fusion protein)